MNTPRNNLSFGCLPLAIAAAMMLAGAAAAPDVQAQSRRAKMEAIRAKQKGEAAPAEKQKAEALYPQATREEPGSRPTRSGAKKLAQVQELYNEGDYAQAMSLANEVAGDEDANAYDKSFAYLLAGSAAGSSGDDAAAVDYFRKALEAGGLDNDNHYTAMYNLAVTEYGLGQNQQALATLDRYLAESGSTQVEARNLRGALLVSLERYDDAASLYAELLAANPDNKSLLLNAVAAYQQAGNDAQAMALLDDARARGALNDPTAYRALYVSYINADRDVEATTIIEEGLAKGILQAGPQLAKDYMVLGQKAYYGDDMARAARMYEQAASMATDGEAALNLAKVYVDMGRTADARAAAQQALDKGVQKPEEARQILGGG